MGHGAGSGNCQSKQQNKGSKSKMDFFEYFTDLSASVIKPHSFSKLSK